MSSAADRELLQQLIRQANTCGSSFYFRRNFHDDLAAHNCNERLRRGFELLGEHYRQQHPWRAAIEVPLRNIGKALFKNRLVAGSSASQLLIAGMFAWRSALLVLGLWGSWRLRREPRIWPLLAFSIFMYGFICLFFHSLEMRYLLQSDTLLLVPAATMIWTGQKRVKAVSISCRFE